MNLAERCAYFARWRPEDVAIRTSSGDVSWRALGDRVAQTASGLAKREIGVGDRVGILAANSVEWCVLALATMHRGAVLVPLNVRLAPPELKSILEHSGCKAVAYDTALSELYGRAVSEGPDLLRISLDGSAEADLTMTELAETEPIEVARRVLDDPALIGYTSGTTGLPKGAILTHGNLAACAQQTALAEGSTFDRRTLLCIPLAFTGGVVNNFLATYAVGGMLVLEPTFDPERVIELLASERITTWFAVPVMWQAVAATPSFANADLSSMTTAICGGAPVPRTVLEAYHEKGVAVRQAYGLTEATGSVCLLPRGLSDRVTAAGMANVDTRLKLVDDEGNEVPTGEVGEICVQGPQVMAGYWDDEAATAEAIRDGWLRTGDLAKADDDGLIYVVDRKKSMFISGGLNVYPAEIERIVDSLDGIEESVAFGLEHEKWGEQCAIVVRTSGDVDADAIIAHCREHLADYKVPRNVFFADEPLPRGMSGKLQRNEIPAKYARKAEASASQ